ncbi:MAG: Saccharopine dehydrogenase [Frankiales bacterium]|nr:Saccharopine dehydrogenase [Frankiales bacterium]
MPSHPSAKPTRTVALLGATGYTGRLTAAELERRGIAHRVGGRSKTRLADVPSSGERHLVDLADPASLDVFLDGVDVLITCVGPFSALGMPVVEAAVRTGTPYVDSTGETTFMRHVYDRFRGRGPAVVPACGFDYIPGDLGVAVAAQELGSTVDEVDVVYTMSGAKPTRGTAMSAVGIIADAKPQLGRLVVAGEDRPVPAVRLPWGEEVTVPFHQPLATVRTGVGAPDWLTRVSQAAAPVSSWSGPLIRATRPLLNRWAERLPEGPSDTTRGSARAKTYSVVRGGGGEVRVVVRVRDVYGITARFLVAASQQVQGVGALATAEALDARAFLDSVAYDDEGGSLTWDVL